MNFIVSAVSDRGEENQKNEDSVAVRSAMSACGHMCMAVVCDGLGGLMSGEVASAHVVLKMKEWFVENAMSFTSPKAAAAGAKKYLDKLNDQLLEYGREKGVMVGTTATILFLAAGKYGFVHVGDTRIYRLNNGCRCITTDQSVNDRVLTQCVGGTERLLPQTGGGTVCRGNRFLLCSDGFRHKNDAKNFSSYYRKRDNRIRQQMEYHTRQLIERCRYLGEKDNVTAVVIRIV